MNVVNKGYVLGHTAARAVAAACGVGRVEANSSLQACWLAQPGCPLQQPTRLTHPSTNVTYVCTISELAPSKFTTRPERSGERPSLSFSVGARGVAVAKVGFIYILVNSVKFIHSEKATKFCEISPLLLTAVHKVKSKGKISQNFAAFLEYMNFT